MALDGHRLPLIATDWQVLEELSTNKMASLQHKIQDVRTKLAGGQALARRSSAELSIEPAPTDSKLAYWWALMVARAGGCCAAAAQRVRVASEGARALCRSPKEVKAREAELKRFIAEQTAELDAVHPELVQVRAALVDRLQKVVDDGTDTSNGCLILDEKSIEYCGTVCEEALAQVGHAARSVVACRARKDQKAQMLYLIKKYVEESCCLAIGDGANDVAMIQAGQIGVGIIGKEGMQAVNNSDFAIGQFRFLRSLLLVHGRAFYKRMALFYYYTIYKGVVLCLPMWLFSCFALGSVNINLYTPFYYAWGYACLFTAAPILVVALQDWYVLLELSLEGALSGCRMALGVRRDSPAVR